MGFWNPRARCPNCGAKIHTTALGYSTGHECPYCHVKLTGSVSAFTNVAKAAPVQPPKTAVRPERPPVQGVCTLCGEKVYQDDEICSFGHDLGSDWEKAYEAREKAELKARPAGIPVRKRPPVEQSEADQEQASDAVADDPQDLVSQIERLGQLRKDGLLSQEEFDAAKAKLLAE